MWKLTWHSFPRRMWRAVLLAAVVAFTVALLSCLLSVGRTIASTADALAKSAVADLSVLPKSWMSDADSFHTGGTDLSPDVVDKVAAIEGVEEIQPRILGRGVIPLRSNGTAYTPALAATESGAFEESDISHLVLEEGRAPESPSEVVVDATTLKETGHQVGDVLIVSHDLSSRTMDVTIVGVVKAKDTSMGASSFVLFSPQRARELFLSGQEGWNAIGIALTPGSDRGKVTEEISSVLPYGYSTVTPSEIERAQRFWLHPPLTSALIALGLIAIVVVVTTIALAGTTFGRLSRMLREAMGSLRAMGISRFLAWRTVMTEALAVGAAGSLLGVLLGFAFQGLAHHALAEAGLPIGPPSPGMGIDGALAVFVAGVVCTLIGSNQHAMSASRTYPVGVRRFVRVTGWLGDEAWSGVGLVAVALVLMLFARIVEVPFPLLWSVLSAVILVAGAVLATSMLGLPFFRWLGNQLSRWFGGLAKVAAQQATNSPARITIGAAALLFGAAVFSATTIITASGEATARERIPESFSTTHLVRNERGHAFSSEIGQRITAIPEVTGVASVSTQEIEYNEGTMVVAGAEPGQFESIFNMEMKQGRTPTKPNEIMISEEWAKKQGLELSGLIRFNLARRPVALRIVGFYEVAGNLKPAHAVTTREALKVEGMEATDSWLGISLTPDAGDVSERVSQTFGENPLLRFTSPGQLAEERAAAVRERFRPFAEVFDFALASGLLGVGLLLALSSLDRHREYGALRVVGTHPRQLAGMLAGESIALTALGLGSGVVAGIISGFAIQHGLSSEGISVLAPAWGSHLLALLWTLPLGLLAAVPAAALAYRSQVTDSIPTSA